MNANARCTGPRLVACSIVACLGKKRELHLFDEKIEILACK
jgi:hypothetical protein